MAGIQYCRWQGPWDTPHSGLYCWRWVREEEEWEGEEGKEKREGRKEKGGRRRGAGKEEVGRGGGERREESMVCMYVALFSHCHLHEALCWLQYAANLGNMFAM